MKRVKTEELSVFDARDALLCGLTARASEFLAGFGRSSLLA